MPVPVSFNNLTPVTSAKVPRGKRIILWRLPNGKNPTRILENFMILGEDLVLDVSSTFSPIMNSSSGLTTDIIGTVFGPNVSNFFSKAASGTAIEAKFKEQSLQIWENTSPLSFSITIALYMLNKSETQVMTPTRELMKLVVPLETDNGLLLPPGPSASFALSKKLEKEYSEKKDGFNPEEKQSISETISGLSTFETYQIQIGNYLFLDSVVITRAEPILSNNSDDQGKPIWAKIRLDVQTTHACTKQTIDGFMNATNDRRR